MKLKRLSKTSYVALGVATLGFGVLAMMGWVSVKSYHAQQVVKQTAHKDQAVMLNLSGFSDSLKSVTTYSTTPEAQKTAFVAAKAPELGLSPQQVETVTPSSLVGACMQEQAIRLSSIVNANPDPEAIERNKDVFTEAVQKYQEYCYKTYSAAGAMTEADMPHEMHH